MAGRTVTAHWNESRNGQRPTYQYKKISDKMIKRIEGSVKAYLHASRDSLRNFGYDTSIIRYDVNEAYYGQAFGIMSGLEIMGYGHLASCNCNGLEDSSTSHSAKQPEHNLRWWFEQLSEEVLEEENYNGDGHCDYCINRRYSDTKTAKAAGRLNREEKKTNYTLVMKDLRDFAADYDLKINVAAKLSELLDRLNDSRLTSK